jgi:penicillin G amidase
MQIIKWIRRALIALLLLALLAGLVTALYAWRASPQHSGNLQASGLQAKVKIDRDAHGVPTIEAESDADLAYALGFTHAQDRGWQLEVQRRIGAGRLSEAFGATALETDRFLRALGVRRAAQAQWDWGASHGNPQARKMAEAYANGINAGWRSQARPPEMIILGLQFEEWTPVDSLAWALMMAWDLGGNWKSELERFRLALQLPAPVGERAAQIAELLPPYPGDRLPALADYPNLYASLGLGSGTPSPALQLADYFSSGVEGIGSNNWAVAASHSANGQALLANDPHLKLQAPALWYLARLKRPGFEAAGGTLPGLPHIVLGQNQHIAWAFTNTGPDTQDLYLEEIRESEGRTEVRTPNGWQAATLVEEVIRIKGGQQEVMKLRIGRHGPFISDAGAGKELLRTTGRRQFALALRWTALEPTQDPLGAAFKQNRAKNFAEYREAMKSWQNPQQSMLVAEKSGDIHFIAPGHIPVRAPENDLHGLLPAPGWEARYDWQGSIPFDALPQENKPARGWLATANQKIHANDYAPHLSHEWALPHRQQRIEHLLQAIPKHTLDTLATMQADVLSLGALPLLKSFKAAHSDHPLAAKLAAQQAAFEGHMNEADAAPALFWAWLRHFTEGVLSDDLGPTAPKLLASRSFRDAIERIAQTDNSPWCDERSTSQVETCPMQANAALGKALDELQTRLGGDPSRWQYGELHRAKAEHRPFSRVPLLRPFFELSAPSGGDPYGINVASVRFAADWAGERYQSDHGPSLRALYDLGDPTRSRVMISTGQSGLPWSRQYRDLLKPWMAVQYLPLWSADIKETINISPK